MKATSNNVRVFGAYAVESKDSQVRGMYIFDDLGNLQQILSAADLPTQDHPFHITAFFYATGMKDWYMS